MTGRSALHGRLVVEIPFQDQLVVPVHMDMTRRMVALPRQEDEATTPDSCHDGVMLPHKVTLLEFETSRKMIVGIAAEAA